MLKRITKQYFRNRGGVAKLIAVLFGGLLTQGVWAQQQYNEKEPLLLLKGLEYKLEAQASLLISIPRRAGPPVSTSINDGVARHVRQHTPNRKQAPKAATGDKPKQL